MNTRQIYEVPTLICLRPPGLLGHGAWYRLCRSDQAEVRRLARRLEMAYLSSDSANLLQKQSRNEIDPPPDLVELRSEYL